MSNRKLYKNRDEAPPRLYIETHLKYFISPLPEDFFVISNKLKISNSHTKYPIQDTRY